MRHTSQLSTEPSAYLRSREKEVLGKVFRPNEGDLIRHADF